MRRVLIILAVVGVAAVAPAALASAGLDETPPATVAYTVLIENVDRSATGEDAAVPLPASDALDVGVLQGRCEGRLAVVDLTTGAVTPLAAAASLAACVGDLAFAPDGTLYGLLQAIDLDIPDVFAELVRFDTTTGQATVIGRIGDFSASAGVGAVPVGGLSFDPQARLLVEVAQSNGQPNPDPACLGDDGIAFCLYRLDDPSQPAAATFVGVSRAGPVANFQVGTVSSDCTVVRSSLLTVSDTVDDELTALDRDSGVLASLGATRDARSIVGQAFDAAGTLWGIEAVDVFTVPSGFELVTLDPDGGSPVDTEVTTLGVDIEVSSVNGLAIEPLDCKPEAVPEPLVLVPTFTG